MPDNYIDQYGDFIHYSSTCTSCGSNQWKSASLIHKEGIGKLSKLCAPPNKPVKPTKILPRKIRAPLSIIFVLFVTLTLGRYLGIELPKILSDSLEISSESPLFHIALIVCAFVFLVGIFAILKSGFSNPIINNDLKEKWHQRDLIKFERQVKNYPQLRVCMRCGKHYMGGVIA